MIPRAILDATYKDMLAQYESQFSGQLYLNGLARAATYLRKGYPVVELGNETFGVYSASELNAAIKLRDAGQSLVGVTVMCYEVRLPNCACFAARGVHRKATCTHQQIVRLYLATHDALQRNQNSGNVLSERAAGDGRTLRTPQPRHLVNGSVMV